jgi:hypothetical protein
MTDVAIAFTAIQPSIVFYTHAPLVDAMRFRWIVYLLLDRSIT